MEITLKQAAHHVGLGERQMQRLVAQGLIASRLVGYRRMIDVDSLEAFYNAPRRKEFAPLPPSEQEELEQLLRRIVREELQRALG